MRINWGVYVYHLGGVRIVATIFRTLPKKLFHTLCESLATGFHTLKKVKLYYNNALSK